MWFALVVLLVLLAVIALGVVAFNRLRTADVAAEEALGGIDVQLTRRADLIPNLVNTVKGYAAHERTVLDEVTEARVGVATATGKRSVEEKAVAQGRLDRAIFDVLAVAEDGSIACAADVPAGGTACVMTTSGRKARMA